MLAVFVAILLRLEVIEAVLVVITPWLDVMLAVFVAILLILEVIEAVLVVITP